MKNILNIVLRYSAVVKMNSQDVHFDMTKNAFMDMVEIK